MNPALANAPAVAPPAFEVSELHVHYGGAPVLRGVSLRVEERSICAVLGPSGCGKSTLLRVLNRTLELVPGAKVESGRASFRGDDVQARGSDARALRKRVGLIPQRPTAFPMSIAENVLFGVRFHGHWRGRRAASVVEGALVRAGLFEEVKDRLKEPAAQLSLGQLQRLCIARTLANEPEALLLDEPCSALDPVSTQRIEETLRSLAAELPVLLVTHHVAQARRLAHRAVVFIDGRVAASGTPDQALGPSADARVVDFVEGRSA